MDKIVSLGFQLSPIREAIGDNELYADDLCYEVVARCLFCVQIEAELLLDEIVTRTAIKHKSISDITILKSVVSNSVENLKYKINESVRDRDPLAHFHLRYVLDGDEYVISDED